MRELTAKQDTANLLHPGFPLVRKKPMSVLGPLRSIPLFSHLREQDMARIGHFARERSYPKNSVIVFEEDPGDSLYVVMSGQVKVVLIGEDGRARRCTPGQP